MFSNIPHHYTFIQYYSYEQHPDETEYHVVDYPYWSNYDPQSYIPYRLKGISLDGLSFNGTETADEITRQLL